MKKLVSLLLGCCVLTTVVKAQKSWKYDFGTATGNLSPTSAAGVLSTDDDTDALLPAPADGQLARVWTGNNNVGGYTLTTSGTVGSGAKLLLKSPSATSTSKFSILNIDGTALMSVGFKLKFEAGTNARYRFAVGRDVTSMNWSTAKGGTQMSNEINFNDMATTLPSFLLMQWDLSSSNYTLKIRKQASTDNNVTFSGWETLNAELNPTISFVNGGTYDIQLYANNGSTSATYTKNDVVQTIAARSCHIWVNNTQLLYATSNPNFKDEATGIAADAALNAFIFLGYYNSGNDAQVYLDDFTYANYLEDITVLPVILDGFSATKQHNSVLLNWKTLSERNNARFDIFRAGDKDQTFELLKTVPGKGNTTTVSTYSAIDDSPLAGNNYYKLVQVDHNGVADTLGTASVNIKLTGNTFQVYQAEGEVKSTIYLTKDSNVTLEILDISGKRVFQENLALKMGYNQLAIPAKLKSGIYVAALKAGSEQMKVKFIYN